MARYFRLETEDDLRRAAFASVPLLFRLFRFSLPLSVAEKRVGGWAEWKAWKLDRRAGDKIWPFEFNQNTLAMRKGLLILRKGKVHLVLVTELS